MWKNKMKGEYRWRTTASGEQASSPQSDGDIRITHADGQHEQIALDDPAWEEYAALFDMRRSDFRACPDCNATHRVGAHLWGWDLDVDTGMDYLELPDRLR